MHPVIAEPARVFEPERLRLVALRCLGALADLQHGDDERHSGHLHLVADLELGHLLISLGLGCAERDSSAGPRPGVYGVPSALRRVASRFSASFARALQWSRSSWICNTTSNCWSECCARRTTSARVRARTASGTAVFAGRPAFFLPV